MIWKWNQSMKDPETAPQNDPDFLDISEDLREVAQTRHQLIGPLPSNHHHSLSR